VFCHTAPENSALASLPDAIVTPVRARWPVPVAILTRQRTKTSTSSVLPTLGLTGIAARRR